MKIYGGVGVIPVANIVSTDSCIWICIHIDTRYIQFAGIYMAKETLQTG